MTLDKFLYFYTVLDRQIIFKTMTNYVKMSTVLNSYVFKIDAY